MGLSASNGMYNSRAQLPYGVTGQLVAVRGRTKKRSRINDRNLGSKWSPASAVWRDRGEGLSRRPNGRPPPPFGVTVVRGFPGSRWLRHRQHSVSLY